MTADLDLVALKDRTKRAWSLGDYDRIAGRVTAPAARRVVDACAVSAGQEVLDVAAGTGNVALLAAREGARVVAADLTPEMVARGRERSREADLDIEWVVADVEELPFEDASFDCVTSAFGAMFAPRPDVVARELFRVLRPGGSVGLASWTPGSFIAGQAAIMSRYLPPDPGLPRPTDWSDPAVVAHRFDGLAASLETGVEAVVWEGESAAEYVAALSDHAGPHVAARRALGTARYEQLLAEVLEFVRSRDIGQDSFRMAGEYLLVVARKRG